MKPKLPIIKGIHPGLILERELKQRHLSKGPFTLSLQEYPQNLVSITKGKRRMNTNLALKIENALEIEEGYFMTLQLYNDIEKNEIISFYGIVNINKRGRLLSNILRGLQIE